MKRGPAVHVSRSHPGLRRSVTVQHCRRAGVVDRLLPRYGVRRSIPVVIDCVPVDCLVSRTISPGQCASWSKHVLSQCTHCLQRCAFRMFAGPVFHVVAGPGVDRSAGRVWRGSRRTPVAFPTACSTDRTMADSELRRTANPTRLLGTPRGHYRTTDRVPTAHGKRVHVSVA